VPPEAGRIAPRLDAAVFAQTVREFVREVDLEEAGRQARAWVERRYAWPAVLPGLLEHYRALCGVPSLLPVPVAAEVADAWQGGR
jgi:alpha-1,6-mannosyltransferase